MIRNFTVRVLIIIMTLTLLAIVYVQWMWISNAVEVRRNQFQERMDYVLRSVVSRIEQESYARLSSKVGEKLKKAGIIQEKDISDNRHSIVDSLMITSGYFQGFDRYSRRYSGNNYSVLGSGAGSESSQKIFSQIVESAVKKFNITEAESPEQFERTKKSLESFIINILRESDTKNLSTKERLKDIPVGQYLYDYLKYDNVQFSYKLINSATRDSLFTFSKKDNYYIRNPFPGDFRSVRNYLCVTIKDQRSYLLRSISWLLIGSSLCIIFLCVVFGYTVFIILRQKKLSEVKNDFINNMTHEFKTPIATINLATSAIKNPKVIGDKEQIFKFNDMVIKENKRMLRHVEKILQQARLDRREIDIRKEVVDINQLIHEAKDHFMLQCKEKNVLLEIDIQAKKPEIIGDEVHILNCIVNLIDNSIKYSKKEPKILVYSKNVSSGVLIGVKDNGIGMSRESQKLVFTRFYRVTNGNIHNVKGFGLGLSYVKSIVKAHGGTIHLKSKLNKGTTIEVVFPKK